MTWLFDQGPNVACLTCRSVLDGTPVRVVTHYDDDDSWAFLDGTDLDERDAMVVAMKSVVNVHPDLAEIADLPPGWSARRAGAGQPWVRRKD
jgi:hypothetical protein